MRPLIVICALAAALVLPGAAPANFFAGTAIDGPSGELQAVGDLDLARDGTGALAYVKRDAGADHIFVARFSGGVFSAPERIDGTVATASSKPVVGAADAGRFVVAFESGGIVYGMVKPAGAPYSAPTALGAGTDPAVDMSINGTAFATFTSAGDVRVARLDRRTNTWAAVPQPADVNPASLAGVGTGRSKVAISADGVGVVTWGEAGRVYARKMFNTGLSNAPQDLTPPDLAGRVATTSDLPGLDAEDDSNFVWVVFRQFFADGGSRVLARRQRGTEFDPPVPLDTGDEAVDDPRIEFSGRGVGLATMAGLGSRQPMVAVLEDDRFGPGARIASPGVAGPLAVPMMAENNDGFVASVVGPAGQAPFVRVRPYEEGDPRPEATVSAPGLGPVEAGLGFDAAIDRAGSAVLVWIQAAGDGRRLVAGYYDRPPLSFAGYTGQRCCRPAAPLLSWQPAFDLWGAVRYEVLVDGRVVGRTTDTRLQLTAPLSGATHRWQVRATDVRGQQKRSRTRLLRIDDLRPRQSIRYERRGRRVTVSVRAREVSRSGHRSSGVRDVVVTWGDGTRSARGARAVRATHRYRRAGTFALEIATRDNAGNRTVSRRTVRVG